jgi:CheY-like chemotaxis protein
MLFIVVLEDEERREQVMRSILSESLPYQAQFFDNAPDMIDWLGSHLAELALICLDHDLGPNRRRSEQVFDPGTGRDVVDFLIQHPPICSVIVHTSNGYSAPGMMFAFEYAGWSAVRVVPYNDLDWITQAWAKAVKENLPA